MRPCLPLLIAPLLLAGCDVHTNPATKDGSDVHISMTKDDAGKGRMALNVPGLDAKISIPGFMMNSHMDIDGMQLAPGTQIKTVDVHGQDDDKAAKDDGSVHMTFTNPKGPAELVAYYRQAASDAGFTISPISGDAGLAASKGTKKFTLSLNGDGGGSRGTIDVTGDD